MKKIIFALLSSSFTATAEPIRIGKQHQLFLDDHLIEHTEHLTRRVQQARKHGANPMIVPRAKWEPEDCFCYASGVIKDKRETDPLKRYKIANLWIDRKFQRTPTSKPGKLTKLAARQGQPVRLEFSVQNSDMFSIWVE